MNSTAKTTALSFLAASALGAAVFMGCTVTNNPNDFPDSGFFDDDSSVAVDTDSGSDSAVAPVCQSGLTAQYIVNAECQTCLDANCCTQQKALFAIPTSGTQIGGNDYITSIDQCSDSADQQKCYDDADSIAAPGVLDAFKELIACKDANTACTAATACGTSDDQADGGVDAGN